MALDGVPSNVRISLTASRRRPATAELLLRWQAVLPDPVRLSEPAFGDTPSDMVAALVQHPGDVPAVLRRFGRAAGRLGWPLEDVSSWVAALADRAGVLGDPLRGFGAGAALGEAWAEGFVEGDQQHGVDDPLTGLATPAVLRRRLAEVTDHCRSLGLPAGQMYVVGVVDTDLAAVAPLVRDAVRVTVADRAARRFHSGETLCSAGDRLLVLAAATPETRSCFDALLADLEHLPLPGGASVGWLEPLPADRADLDRFLADLTG